MTQQQEEKWICPHCYGYAEEHNRGRSCHDMKRLGLFRDRFPSQAKQAQMLEEIRLIAFGG